MDLFSKRLLVVSGKGGVGKTVISSALALIGARRGKRVLLVKMDDQGRTSQLFGTPPLSDRIEPLKDGVSAVNLDPKTIVADYLVRQLRIKRLVQAIVDSRLFAAWFRVSPAIPEMISLGKVEALVDEKSWWRSAPVWDLVVFDAPATGHGLGILRLPEQASKLLIGGMRKNALAVQALLEDKRTTSLLLVTLPEEMPVNEAVHFYEEARSKTRVPLAALVLNGAHPRRVAAGEAALAEVDAALAAASGQAALASVGADAPAVRRASELSQTRAELTDRYRAELDRRLPLPRVEVPHLFAEKFGLPELEQVASILEPALAALPEADA